MVLRSDASAVVRLASAQGDWHLGGWRHIARRLPLANN